MVANDVKNIKDATIAVDEKKAFGDTASSQWTEVIDIKLLYLLEQFLMNFSSADNLEG